MSRESVLISVAELNAALTSSGGAPTIALLDVRWRLGEPAGAGHQRYAAAHLPGARFLDLEKVLTRHTGDPKDGRHPLPDLDTLETGLGGLGVNSEQPVVVYDEAGSFAAGRAWWVLRWAGLNVRVLDGGIDAWIRAGLPLASSTPDDLPAVDTAFRGVPPVVLSNAVASSNEGDIGSGRLPTLTADEAAAVANSARGVLVDVRAPERFRGETEPLDPVAGHIPGAINIPVASLFAPADAPDPGAMPAEEHLRARLAPLITAYEAGMPCGVYCGSGVSAAQAVLAMATLGIEVPLYPGSWSAWSNDPTRPVATGP